MGKVNYLANEGRIDVSEIQCTGSGRERRVLLLLAGVILLSLADLLVTLMHLQSIGMVESNPLAAYLIQATDSPWALAAFKGLTVIVCVALLYKARHHLQGEIASWLAVSILVGVSVMWHYYAEANDHPDAVRIAQIINGDDWLMLD